MEAVSEFEPALEYYYGTRTSYASTNDTWQLKYYAGELMMQMILVAGGWV
jgi:hypothetical protein